MKNIKNLFVIMILMFSVLNLSGCADLKAFGDWLAEDPPASVKYVFPSGSTNTSNSIDDVFARLDGRFHFDDPDDYGDTPIHQWVKHAGAKYKAIPGVSYEIFQPFTAERGKLKSAYGRYNKNGQVWLWLDLKKDGNGTRVRYKTSGSKRLHQAATQIEKWVLEAINA